MTPYSQVHFPVEGFLANGSAAGGLSDFWARSPKPEKVEVGAAAAADEEGDEASWVAIQ